MNDPSNRRQYERISVGKRVPVLIQYTIDGKMTEGWGRVIDISLGGLCFESRFVLQNSQVLYLTFNLTENFKFGVTKSVIMWVKPGSYYQTYGVKFESLVVQQHLTDALKYFSELQKG